MVRGIYIVWLTLSHETTIIALHLPILQALPKAHTEAATRATAMARRWKSLPLKTGPIPVIFQVGSNLRAHNVRLVRFHFKSHYFELGVGHASSQRK